MTMHDSQRTYIGLKAHVSGAYTKGSLLGKEYIVVPVVALVEGVIQGMTAETPELALAEEFGKFVDSWNGRPIVMNHPVIDGSPVSANSPNVLDTYQLGFIFNSALVDGKKLTLEAWVDPDRMKALNDNSAEILKVLEAGEMIEVSTGYFAMLEQVDGIYNNESYSGIQRNIVPDHLAFLAVGTIGACSNKDGCGAQLAVNAKVSDSIKQVFTFHKVQPCCDECAKAQKDAGNMTEQTPNAQSSASEGTVDEEITSNRQNPEAYEQVRKTIANSIDGSVTLDDASRAVRDALRAFQGSNYIYVVAMTSEVVVYEMYNGFTGVYETYQRGYSVTADGIVTLEDTAERVMIMSKIVKVNSEGKQLTDNQESEMTEQTSAAPAATPKTHKIENDQGTLEVTLNEKGEPTAFTLTPKVHEAPKPKTTEEFIAQAPREMQEVLSSSLKLHQERKDTLLTTLKAAQGNKFSEEFLKAQSLEMLENLASLANVPSYNGRALPIQNNEGDDNQAPPAPLVFEAPQSSQAA